jgi:hypothetical protein
MSIRGKLDPLTNIKILDIKSIPTPISPQQDEELRKDFQTDFVPILNGTLKYFNIPMCSGKITMATTVKLQDKAYINNPLFGNYKFEDANQLIDNSTLDISTKSQLKNMLITSKYALYASHSADIETIKKQYKECLSNDLFVVHLTIYPISDTGLSGHITHANILVISKARGTVYWIEPQTTLNTAYEELMIKSIKKLVSEIGMTDPEVINPVETCPQMIAGDKNCMFWSYIILLLILLNPGVRDHNTLIKGFMNKYSTKEALINYMNGLKLFMVDPDKYKGSGRRRSIRRKHIKKRSKTYRRR